MALNDPQEDFHIFIIWQNTANNANWIIPGTHGAALFVAAQDPRQITPIGVLRAVDRSGKLLPRAIQKPLTMHLPMDLAPY
jgi:hypothetical protein